MQYKKEKAGEREGCVVPLRRSERESLLVRTKATPPRRRLFFLAHMKRAVVEGDSVDGRTEEEEEEEEEEGAAAATEASSSVLKRQRGAWRKFRVTRWECFLV